MRDAEVRLREREQTTQPNSLQVFVRRLNDFLRAARSVSDFLKRETGHTPGLKNWAKQEENNLLASDTRFSYFVGLRDESTHRRIVEPSRQHVDVQVFDVRIGPGSPSPGAILASAYDFGSPGAENVVQSTSAKYYFVDWPSEDVVTFCREIVGTLRGLVTRAYQQFP